MSLWSYPNLFRNQKVGGKGDGKELSDLVVICGNDVIIFSDKSCAYPDTGKEQLDWSRWFRKSIADSARQAFGAERWLKEFPDAVFMDRACTVKPPVPIPRGTDVRFHRVIVALNAKDRCRKKHNGGSGSLMLHSDLVGPDAHTEPYAVGMLEPKKGYVHVFDDVSLDIVMRELDTITDFVRYLDEKEHLLTRTRVIADGEEELLGYFLRYTNAEGRHYFKMPDTLTGIWLTEGMWEWLQVQPQYRAKKDADAVSYVWDRIIEDLTRHALGGTLRSGGETDIGRIETGLRYMALEDRVSRRFYGTGMMEVWQRNRPGMMNMRSIESFRWPGLAYVFMFCGGEGIDHDRYRRGRVAALSDYCLVFGYANRKYERIIGLATEGPGAVGSSTDLLLLENRNWPAKMEADAKAIQAKTGWQKPQSVKRTEVTMYEYPHPIANFRERYNVGSHKPKIGPNQLCPCGSGRKFKRCCMIR